MKNKIPLSIGRFDYNSFDLLVYSSDSCNYNCPYCYNRTRSGNFIDLENLYDFVYKLRYALPQKKMLEIEFIGGEPSIQPDIDKFCKKISETIDNCEMYMYTNFSQSLDFYLHLSNFNVKFDSTLHLKNADVINDFLYKVNNIPTDKFRGVVVMYEKGNHKDAIDAYKKLSEIKNLDVDLQLIITNGIVDSYKKDQINLYKEVVQNCEHKFYTIKYKDGSIEKHSHNSLPERHFKRWLCNARKELLYVHYNGDVYYCDGYFNEGKEPCGNISQHFEFEMKPIICEIDSCPFQDNVVKTNIFLK